jgi:hypothetical protein
MGLVASWYATRRAFSRPLCFPLSCGVTRATTARELMSGTMKPRRIPAFVRPMSPTAEKTIGSPM